MEQKQRLDILLMRKTGYGREFSKEIIEKGVSVNGRLCTKPGEKFAEDVEIDFTPPENLYVSRGGYKLEKALDFFKIDLRGCVCVDVGASTGGFTDCMLKNGASMVYAIDAGHSQLAESLKNDARVVSMEKCNIKNISECNLPLADFLSADLSFISLTKVMEHLSGLMKDGAYAVLLIKPQFEAGRKYLNKKGIVKDIKIQSDVIVNVAKAAVDWGLSPLEVTSSPIKGQDGNTEYLFFVKKGSNLGNSDFFTGVYSVGR